MPSHPYVEPSVSGRTVATLPKQWPGRLPLWRSAGPPPVCPVAARTAHGAFGPFDR